MDSLRQFLEVESLVSPTIMLLAALIVAGVGLSTARGFWRRQLAFEGSSGTPSAPAGVVPSREPSFDPPVVDVERPGDAALPEPAPTPTLTAPAIKSGAAADIVEDEKVEDEKVEDEKVEDEKVEDETRAALAEIAARAAAMRDEADAGDILTLRSPLPEPDPLETPVETSAGATAPNEHVYTSPPSAPPLNSAGQPPSNTGINVTEGNADAGLALARPPGVPIDAPGVADTGVGSPVRRDYLPLAQKLARNLARRSVSRRSDGRQAAAVGLSGHGDELTRAVKALYDHRDGARPLAGIDSVLAELEQGNSMAAEGVFRTILEQKRRGGRAAMRDAAQAARALGAIARLRDEQAARLAYEEAVTLDDRDPVAWNELGHLRRRAGQYDLARQAYEQVLALGNQMGNRAAMAAATGNLGVIAIAQGNRQGALIRFREALSLAQEVGDRSGEAAAFGNLGLTYQELGNTSEAERHFVASLGLHDELDMPDRMAADHGSLGLVYDSSNMLEQAESHLQQAVEISEAAGHRQAQALHAGTLGVVQQKRGDFSAAEQSHELAIGIAKALGHEESVADGHGNLGAVAHRLGDLDKACNHWRTALAMYLSQGNSEQAARVREWLDYAKCPENGVGG